MSHKATKSLLVVGATAMVVSALVVPATADISKICKSQVSTGYGTGSKPDASKAAVAKWVASVKADYGANWSNWNLAEGKLITCKTLDASIKRMGCQALAKPCGTAKLKKKKIDTIEKIEPKS